MSSSRHQRRKAAQQRLEAKSLRIAGAARAFEADQRDLVIGSNLSQPQSRNRILPQTVDMSVRLMGSTHRGFSGQGVGGAQKVIVASRFNAGRVAAAENAKPRLTREALRHGGREEALVLLAAARNGSEALGKQA